jgi:hypothetical protein
VPRKYTVEFDNITWTAAQTDIDVFSIDPATDKPTAITGIIVKATSEVQEAQESWQRLRVIHGHTTVGSGGAAATARPVSPIDTAYGGSVRTNDTTIASAGTAVNLLSDAFQVRAGYELFLLPEDWLWTSGANFLVVRMLDTVADDITASGTLFIVEYP